MYPIYFPMLCLVLLLAWRGGAERELEFTTQTMTIVILSATPFFSLSLKKSSSSLCTHAFHRTDSKDPDVHVLDGWMPATKTHPARTIHEDGMWPSTKTECDYLNGWIKKRSHTQKYHPKVVNPRDIAGERKKKKKKKKKKARKDRNRAFTTLNAWNRTSKSTTPATSSFQADTEGRVLMCPRPDVYTAQCVQGQRCTRPDMSTAIIMCPRPDMSTAIIMCPRPNMSTSICVHRPICPRPDMSTSICPRQYMSTVRYVHGPMCPWPDMSTAQCVQSQMCPRPSVSRAKCVHGPICPRPDVSLARSVQSQMCPQPDMSMAQCVQSQMCPQPDMPTAHCVQSQMCPRPDMSTAQCVPDPMCPWPDMSTARCVPGPKYPQPNVSTARYVHSPMCPGPNVYLAPCVHSPMCPGSNVSPARCVHGPKCPRSDYAYSFDLIFSLRWIILLASATASANIPQMGPLWADLCAWGRHIRQNTEHAV